MLAGWRNGGGNNVYLFSLYVNVIQLTCLIINQWRRINVASVATAGSIKAGIRNVVCGVMAAAGNNNMLPTCALRRKRNALLRNKYQSESVSIKRNSEMT